MLIYLSIPEVRAHSTAFEQIYRQYRNLMYHVAFQILQNPQDAEDAVHNAFVKIAENIEKIEEPVCPKTKSFCVTVVENKAIDLYRRKHRFSFVSLDALSQESVSLYSGTNRVAACIAKLPYKYRQVLILKYLHGYTSAETAQILGLTEANVNKIQQRAKARLQLLCQEEGIE